jgi:hypothetical protein
MASHPETITFSYEKSKNFEVVHVDGATARPLASGNVYLSFFLERGHEFEEVVHEVTAEGALGKEIRRKMKDGVCRELQFGIVASPASAKRISDLILETLEKAKSISEPKPKASRN